MSDGAAGASDPEGTDATAVHADTSPLVITVHGTFATASSDDGEQWWQRGSGFMSALTERLASKGIPEIAVQPFRWTGLNSDHARLRAAKVLAGTIAAARLVSLTATIRGRTGER